MKPYAPILSILLSLAACTQPEIDREAEGEALMQLSRDWSALVEAGNLEATVDNWAEDAVMLPPGPPVMPALEGRSAIQAYVEAAAQIPGWKISWEPKSVYVSRSGDLAYMLERNVVTVADSLGNDVTTYGKVVTVWRKDGSGRWRNVVDMWNEAPPPAN